jgi:hypothetical protein
MESESVKCVNLIQGMDKWQFVVKRVMKFRVT